MISTTEMIRERVERIETIPAIPAVFLPLLKLLGDSAESVKVDEVVRLVSYDNAIAAQCLRVAGSPLFGPSLFGSIASTSLTNELARWMLSHYPMRFDAMPAAIMACRS